MEKQVPISFKELRRIASMPIKAFAAYGKKYDTVDGVYFYKNNNAKILFVGHLDSVQPFVHFDDLKLRHAHRVYFPTVDDRLGVWLALCHLPKFGLKYDILLTEGEEKGRSTAQWANIKKKYNWIFSFDRTGTDVVLYQYRSLDVVEELQKFGFTVGMGSFSDICVLDDLGCKGINFGTAYYNYHSPEAYFVKGELLVQVQKFLRFYHANYDRHLEHKNTYIWQSLKKGGGSNKGAYKSSSSSSSSGKATPAGNFRTTETHKQEKGSESTWTPSMGILKSRSLQYGSALEYLTISDHEFLKSWSVPENWYKGKEGFLTHSDVEVVKTEIEKRVQVSGFGAINEQSIHLALRHAAFTRSNQKDINSSSILSVETQLKDLPTITLSQMYFDKWSFDKHIELRMTGRMKQVLAKFGMGYSRNHGPADKGYLEVVARCLINGLIDLNGNATDDSPYVRRLINSAFGERKEKETQNVSENDYRSESIDNCSQCHKAFKVATDDPITICPDCQKANQPKSNQKLKLRIVGGLQLEFTKADKYDYKKDQNDGEFKWLPIRSDKTEPTTISNEQQDTSQLAERTSVSGENIGF